MPDQEVEDEETTNGLLFPEGALPAVPLDSMISLFNWYRRHFCRGGIRDCRGFQVEFREEDFIHLIKLVDHYGTEPKNRTDAVRRIKSGELKLFDGSDKWPANYSIQRAKELACALLLVTSPDTIVKNWQPMGKANPGEAYIRNFGVLGRRRYRVLVCGIAGTRRLPVTAFPRQNFTKEEIAAKLWPK